MFHRLARFAKSILPGWIVGNSIRHKQQALLRILSIAHSQQLDPKTLITNLAAEHPGPYGRKLMLLQRWIAADSSISAALSHTPGVLSEDDALAIQCGIETNTLDETFDYLLERTEADNPTTTAEIIRSSLGYVIGVVCFAILVGTFIMIFIVPTFEQIFEEFGMELPPMMMALIDFSKFCASIFALILLAVLGLGFLLLLSDVRRGIMHSPLGRLLPTTATRRSAGLFRLLAIPTGLGQPIASTLTVAAQFHPYRYYRKRLLLARTEARNDADIWRQLANQGLISKNQGEQLGNIDTPSLRAWTLTKLAVGNHRRANQQAEFLARVLQHVPIILLGIIVGWIAIAVMQTLTDLIRSLA